MEYILKALRNAPEDALHELILTTGESIAADAANQGSDDAAEDTIDTEMGDVCNVLNSSLETQVEWLLDNGATAADIIKAAKET